MAFHVFLSHSLGIPEQVLALRLQTLAAAHGVRMYVPRRPYYQTNQALYDSANREWRREMQQSNCVLGLITNLSRDSRRTLQGELNEALRLNKLVIPLVEQGLKDDELIRHLRKRVPPFVFSTQGENGEVERDVAKYLLKRKATEEERQAIGGLVSLAVGMLLLNAVPVE